MGRRAAPKKPVQCDRWKRWRGERYRCVQPVRTVAQVAEELRDFAATRRATGLRWWSEHGRLNVIGYPPLEDESHADGSDWLAASADMELAGLALELDGKLCQGCARAEAEGRAFTLKLAFLGCMTGLASGRDERPEEEFELFKVAA